MKFDIERLRLKAIRSKFTFFKKKCESCGNIFGLERMWFVDRLGVNNSRHTWCYCTKCMPTAEAVLHEIDTDECPFGIYGIDEHRDFKKDTRRLEASRKRAFSNTNLK